MDKTSDARFDAMMEHYRNEMLRYQRATPPGEEPLAEKLNRKEDFTPAADTCHNCIPKDSVPTVKERPLPSDEEEGFTPSPSPKDDEEAVLTSAPMPLRWQIFFPNMPRPKPPVPKPMPKPVPNRPIPQRPRPPMPLPPVKNQRPPVKKPPMPPKPMPRASLSDAALLASASTAAVDTADRLFYKKDSDFNTLASTLADKLSLLDEKTLSKVIGLLAEKDPDLAAAIMLEIKR